MEPRTSFDITTSTRRIGETTRLSASLRPWKPLAESRSVNDLCELDHTSAFTVGIGCLAIARRIHLERKARRL
jgi:hypothetical protein